MRRENEFRYTKLTGLLREKILTGYIKPGEFLLSENELCKHYGLSRNSIRKSLDQLVSEGLLVKLAGKGAIVPHDLQIDNGLRKVLHIVAPSPSYFLDNGIPIMLDAFRSDYPHVDVKLLTLPSMGYWESIRISGEMGLSPDIILVTDTQFSDSNHLDSFLDLTPLCEESLDNLYPNVLNAFRCKKLIKAVPTTFSTVFLAYNPSLFAAHGTPVPNQQWTRDEFKKAAESLTTDTNGDGILDQYGFSLSSHMSRWPVFALQYGFTPEGTRDNRDTILKTFTFFHDILYHSRCAMFHLNSPKRITNHPFVKGKSGMALTTTFEMSAWENLDFKPRVAPLPLGDVDATLLMANALMIPSGCGEPELAKAFVKIAIRPDVQEKMSRSTPFISVLRNVNEETRSHAFLRNLNILDPMMANNRFLNELIGDPVTWENLQQEIELFWYGLESAESLADIWEKNEQLAN
jgi:multiple sugar transport system substrate-binding protein